MTIFKTTIFRWVRFSTLHLFFFLNLFLSLSQITKTRHLYLIYLKLSNFAQNSAEKDVLMTELYANQEYFFFLFF